MEILDLLLPVIGVGVAVVIGFGYKRLRALVAATPQKWDDELFDKIADAIAKQREDEKRDQAE